MGTNEFRTFDFKGIVVRVITDEKAKPWFVGNDVCGILGYKNPSRSVNDHCNNLKILKLTDSVVLDIPPRGLQIFPESDLYRLVLRSNMPVAESFQDWVVEEVLPQIRMTGVIKRESFTVDLKRTVSYSMTYATPSIPIFAKLAWPNR